MNDEHQNLTTALEWGTRIVIVFSDDPHTRMRATLAGEANGFHNVAGTVAQIRELVLVNPGQVSYSADFHRVENLGPGSIGELCDLLEHVAVRVMLIAGSQHRDALRATNVWEVRGAVVDFRVAS